MLILIASDIHGSSIASDKILELDNKFDFKEIWLLGDINYNGARNIPPEDYSPIYVTQNLLKIIKKTTIIRGNCDSRVDEFVLNKKFKDKVKFKIKNFNFILTHGDLFNKENIKMRKNNVLLYGHTHICELKKEKNYYFINPGSISLPKNNNPKTYLIFDDEKLLFSLYNINDILIDTLSLQ